MTDAQILANIRKRCKKGTQRAVAIELKVSPAYLSEVLKGTRPIGPRILKAYGLERRVSYHPIEDSRVS